jgi:hypothetical protein
MMDELLLRTNVVNESSPGRRCLQWARPLIAPSSNSADCISGYLSKAAHAAGSARRLKGQTRGVLPDWLLRPTAMRFNHRVASRNNRGDIGSGDRRHLTIPKTPES